MRRIKQRVMKKIFILLSVLYLSTIIANGQNGDTVFGQYPRYFYNYFDENWQEWDSIGHERYLRIWPGHIAGRPMHYQGDSCVAIDLSLHDRTETAIRMNSDGPLKLTGVAFCPGPIWYPGQYYYECRIYDTNMVQRYASGRKYVDGLSAVPPHYVSPARYIPIGPGLGFIPMYEILFDDTVSTNGNFYISIVHEYSIDSVDTVWSGLMTCVTLVEYNWDETRNSYQVILERQVMPLERRMSRDLTITEPITWIPWDCNPNNTCIYPIIAIDCEEVTGLRYEPVGSGGTMALVQWDTDPRIQDAYEISYGPAGTPPGAGTVIQTTQVRAVLAQLGRDTRYDVYVRARCNLDTAVWSPWSDTLHIQLSHYGIAGATEPTINIAPNPTTGMLQVTAGERLTKVELYDMQGRRTTVESKINGTSATLRLNTLAAGNYILVANTTEGHATRLVEKK